MTEQPPRVRILIVDDDEDDFFLTSDLLGEVAGTSYEVDWASSYDAGRDRIAEAAHDVCLLDYRLGERTGIDLLREVTAAGCRTPLILLTGQADRELDLEAMHSGAADYLVKGEITASLLERSIRYSLERTRLLEQIRAMSLTDDLTGLANRRLFRDRVEHALTRRVRTGVAMSVLFLDIDNFKAVNDTLGHAEGDRLLVGVAERLRTCVRASDTVARPGGDEFAILLEDATEPNDALRVARRITEAMRQPIRLPDREVFASCSIGVANAEKGLSGDDLLRHADVAMYMAKGDEKGSFRVFEPAMHASLMERLELEADLRGAEKRQEMQLLFQPIVDLDTQRIASVEALVRWDHPTRGRVLPDVFIPIAEETGTIVSLGRWVLREACRQGRKWHRDHPDGAPLTVSVNLSGRQLREPDVVDEVAAALHDTGFPAESLLLEITESVVLKDIDLVLDRLHALKALGVRLAIDDFGTGYSSLSWLHRLPVDTLKIDRSFVDRIGKEDESSPLIHAIVSLGTAMRLSLVAEGIETGEQLEHLKALGAQMGQGYLFSGPVPAGEIGGMLGAGVGASNELMRATIISE